MYPVLFKIGNLGIRSYGVLLVIAFFICLWLAKFDAKRISLSKKLVDKYANYLLLGGLIGARLYYAAFYDPYYYFTKPWTLLFIWEGGLAIHGALLGGVIATYLFCKKKNIPFLKLTDFVAPILLLGQAIGRIGCFLNGCCYGVPTDKPWGMIFAKDSPAYYKYGYQSLHPTQLYEMFLDLIGFILLWSFRRNFKKPGTLFGLYLIYYGIVRFAISFLRADSLYLWGTSIKIAYLVSIFMLIVGAFLVIRREFPRSGM